MSNPDLSERLARATAAYYAAATKNELNARMYAASQNDLAAAERELRELGRAISILGTQQQARPADDPLIAKLREVLLGQPPPAPTPAPNAPKISEVASALADGDASVQAALQQMLTNPGAPLPGAPGH